MRRDIDSATLRTRVYELRSTADDIEDAADRIDQLESGLDGALDEVSYLRKKVDSLEREVADVAGTH